jgi:CBS domain-containing protein
MTVPGAARLMNTSHVRRLPVVDSQGRLAGIVSRRDLLSVFLRPDADVARDARQVLDELPVTDPGDVTVSVRHGVVVLTGTLESASQRYRDLVAVALRLIWDIDGVVDVVSKLGQAVESKTA